MRVACVLALAVGCAPAEEPVVVDEPIWEADPIGGLWEVIEVEDADGTEPYPLALDSGITRHRLVELGPRLRWGRVEVVDVSAVTAQAWYRANLRIEPNSDGTWWMEDTLSRDYGLCTYEPDPGIVCENAEVGAVHRLAPSVWPEVTP